MQTGPAHSRPYCAPSSLPFPETMWRAGGVCSQTDCPSGGAERGEIRAGTAAGRGQTPAPESGIKGEEGEWESREGAQTIAAAAQPVKGDRAAG